MYKEVFWPAVFQKEKLYPEPQANLGRKQTAFSLEGPIQHTHWSQKGGLCPPLSPVPPISFPCARGVGLPWSPRADTKWSAQARGRVPHSLLDFSILSRRLMWRWYQEAGCLVGWEQLRWEWNGRLGHSAVWTIWNKLSASVGMMCCQRRSSPARREGEREEPAAFRVFLCWDGTWKSLTFGLCLLYVYNLNSLLDHLHI